MIRDKIKHNDDVKLNDREIRKLRKEFPQYFNKDGNFLMDRFTDMLIEKDIEIEKEGYELKFLGKSYAKYITSTESMTALTPDIDHNKKEENKNSENVYIVGDNLDAIKHLLNSYSGKIKCIYIDPPYNTGSDGFVYPDDFKFTKESLSNAIGIEEDEAERILNITGKSTHSAWMTFMYPRLMLAMDLLSDDGVIFISIDDNEQANLKLLCDEIFGEGNFEGHIHWRRRHNQPNDKTKMIGLVAEHLLVYAKNSVELKKSGVGKVELTGDFSNPDNDPKGEWSSKPWKVGSDQSGSRYKLKTPTGKILNEEWMGDEDTYNNFLNEGRMYFPNGGNGMPRKKYYKFERLEEGQCATNWWIHDIFGHNQGANDCITELFGTKNIFSNPKPVELLKAILNLSGRTNDYYVLDFFSGSATTAHAVMELNAEDIGNRKYIMVQLPEVIEKGRPAYEVGYRTIDEIGCARIEKAAKKIKEEREANIDYGYKLYRLNELSDKTLDKIVEFNPHETLILEDMREVFRFDNVAGRETILSTWLNADGYGLSQIPKKIRLRQYDSDLVKDSLYIIDPGISTEDVIELIKKIEDNSLNISRIVLYPYSIDFNVLHELKKNIINLRNNKNINVIERY